MLLAGIGAAGALALSRTAARAGTCGSAGPLEPTGPTMRDLYDKVARTDSGLAEARTPITSLPSSATAQYVISAPGVYYMTGNITGEPNKNCIDVQADEVEIECDGFTFFGVAGTLACITASSRRAIGIYDGGFSEWHAMSIDLSTCSHCYVEECWFSLCDATGSLGTCVLGYGGTIDDCNALSCTNGRLAVGPNGTIEECVSLDCTGDCFGSAGPATVEDNFAYNGTGFAVAVTTGAVVTGNRVIGTRGVAVGDGSVVAENDISSCTGPGAIMVMGSNCNVEENFITLGGGGVIMFGGLDNVLIDGNQITGGSGTGITVPSGGCTVIRNAVSQAAGVPGYDINPASSYGTIVDATAGGEIGAATGGVVSPLANLLY